MNKLFYLTLVLLNIIYLNCDGGGEKPEPPVINDPGIQKLSEPYNLKASQGKYGDKIVITWDDDNSSEYVSWYDIYTSDSQTGEYKYLYYNLTCNIENKTCEFSVDKWMNRFFKKYYFKVMAGSSSYGINNSDLSEPAGGYVHADTEKLIYIINYSESKVFTMGKPANRTLAYVLRMASSCDPGSTVNDKLLYMDYHLGDTEYLYYDEYTLTLSDELGHSTIRTFTVDYGQVIYILWETVNGVVQVSTTVESYQWYYDKLYDQLY